MLTGIKFSSCGHKLISPELADITFSILIMDVFLELLPTLIFSPKAFCRFDLMMLILLTSHLMSFGHSFRSVLIFSKMAIMFRSSRNSIGVPSNTVKRLVKWFNPMGSVNLFRMDKMINTTTYNLEDVIESQSLTTVIGIKSIDGVIIASDSQFTMERSKSLDGSKLFKINDFTIAGMSGFSDQMNILFDKLKQRLANKLFSEDKLKESIEIIL